MRGFFYVLLIRRAIFLRFLCNPIIHVMVKSEQINRNPIEGEEVMPRVTRIQLEHALLRPIQMSDASSIALNANNKRVARFVSDRFPYPYSIKDAYKWIRRINSKKKIETVFGVDVDGSIVGAVSVFGRKRHVRGFGYWLGEKYWNQGIVTEAVKELTRRIFKDKRIHRVYAHVYSDNPRSSRVLEKSGFQFEGTLRKEAVRFGKIRDVQVFAKVR